MANRNYGYQYETSPRKLDPEYEKRPVKKKKVQSKKRNVTSKKVQNKKKQQKKVSFEMKFFLHSMLFFAVIFAIIACQAMVNQRYKERESLKKEYSELFVASKATNDMNENARVLASDYGMQTKSATLIDLETTDYIESSRSQVETEEMNLFEKLVNWIKNKF